MEIATIVAREYYSHYNCIYIYIRNPRKKWAQANVAFKKLKKYVHFNVIEKVEVAKMTKSR